MSIKQRILDNIKVEAKNHVKYGTKMPKRHSMWDAEIAQAIISATEQMNTDFEEVYLGIYESCNGTKLPYDQWLTIAKSLYKVEGGMVVSIAKGPDHLKEWGPYKCYGECLAKIRTLLNHKFVDHFTRGRDFMYVPSDLRHFWSTNETVFEATIKNRKRDDE